MSAALARPYIIPVELQSAPRHGKRRREVRQYKVEAASPLTAADRARDLATQMYGKAACTPMGEVFVVRAVEVRLDLAKDGLLT
jgi:hypothetical protein